MILLDTGVLFAAADRRDADHEPCAGLLDTRPSSELVLPALVAAETSWLIGDRLGAATEAAFVASVAAGDFTVEDLTATDWRRAAELLERYTDLGLGLIDAAVITVAERLGATEIATLNERDFRVVRPATSGVHAAALSGWSHGCSRGRAACVPVLAPEPAWA